MDNPLAYTVAEACAVERLPATASDSRDSKAAHGEAAQ